ncbi:D-alanyl-D-alanine carboxypeptidase family protein [Faecalimonas sp.]
MAEYISGDEKTFVHQMNERAKKLGMRNTHFVNCNGLDEKEHLTTARDIAIMSKELISKYPEIYKYTKIWQENITHKTKKGVSEFGLTNTNKFIRQYPYATGLKTGSTGKAKFCLSATAEKEKIKLISVVMSSPNAKQRVKDTVMLMNYGFGKCKKYEDEMPMKERKIKVEKGKKEEVKVYVKKGFEYVSVSGEDVSNIKKKIEIKKTITAPIKKGEKLGKISYSLNKKEIGYLPILAKEKIAKIDYFYAASFVLKSFFL